MKPDAIRHLKLNPGRHSPILEIWENAGGGAILFYPGSLLSPIQYRPLLHALFQAGFTVAALHFTGHGAASHHVLFTFEDLLQNALDAEHWLHAAGYPRPAVCGHSQGGIVALAHASASNGLSAAFPISGIFPQQREAIALTRFSRLTTFRQNILAAFHALSLTLPWLPLPAFAYLSSRRILRCSHAILVDMKGMRHGYPMRFLYSLFNACISTRLRCPLYLLNARDDGLFTPEIIKAVFAIASAPQKHLIWLRDGGHLVAMNPKRCHDIAMRIAARCAGLGFPLHLTAA